MAAMRMPRFIEGLHGLQDCKNCTSYVRRVSAGIYMSVWQLTQSAI
jgi:hypothetical protein